MSTQKYYYGNAVSEYGLENGKVDYAAFAKAFDSVYCDYEALAKASGYDFEPVGGSDYYHELDGIIYTPEEMEEKKEELENRLAELKENEEENEEEISKIEDDIIDLEEIHYEEVFQYYIVPENALSILEENNELVYYSDTLNLYVWGVTHYGTSWSYVLTNISLKEWD